MTSFVSAVPWFAIIIPYIVVALSAQLLHGRFWQSPILAMLLITISWHFRGSINDYECFKFPGYSSEFFSGI